MCNSDASLRLACAYSASAISASPPVYDRKYPFSSLHKRLSTAATPTSKALSHSSARLDEPLSARTGGVRASAAAARIESRWKKAEKADTLYL